MEKPEIIFHKEALRAVTEDQLEALCRLANEYTDRIEVYKGGFDLPDGYLSFVTTYKDPGNGQVSGGISKDGEIST